MRYKEELDTIPEPGTDVLEFLDDDVVQMYLNRERFSDKISTLF